MMNDFKLFFDENSPSRRINTLMSIDYSTMLILGTDNCEIEVWDY